MITDDLSRASDLGRISLAQTGEFGALLVEAGGKFGMSHDYQMYCTALDRIHGRITHK